jgi:hypothetical protein
VGLYLPFCFWDADPVSIVFLIEGTTNTTQWRYIIISLLMFSLWGHRVHILLRGPSANRVLTTENVTETNSFKCVSEAQISSKYKFLFTHSKTGLCESCLLPRSHVERTNRGAFATRVPPSNMAVWWKQPNVFLRTTGFPNKVVSDITTKLRQGF